jgi:hypothetical protein
LTRGHFSSAQKKTRTLRPLTSCYGAPGRLRLLACASCALFLPFGWRSLRKFKSSSAYKQKAPLDAGPFFICSEEDSNFHAGEGTGT